MFAQIWREKYNAFVTKKIEMMVHRVETVELRGQEKGGCRSRRSFCSWMWC